MKLVLKILSGEKKGKKIYIPASQIMTFGRTSDSDCDFEDDGHMSGIHFEVEHTGHAAKIRDRGSRNGTWVDGDRIQAAELRDGHEIKAGRTLLRVSLEEPASVSPSPSRTGSEFDQSSFDQPNTEGSIAPTIDVLSVSSHDQLVDDPYATDSPVAAVEQPLKKHTRMLPETIPIEPDSVKIRPTRRGISPIESVTFPVEQPFAPSDPNASKDVSSPRTSSIHTPFGLDSSRAPGNLGPLPIGEPPITADRGAAYSDSAEMNVGFLRKTFNPEGVENSLHSIVSSLNLRMSMVVVAHFAKIRMTTPADFSSAQPLLDWLPFPSNREHGPVLLNWSDWEKIVRRQLLGRLCRADGIIVFLGSSPETVSAQIKTMMRMEIAGFSEGGGFLGCCWPSTLMALRDSSEKAVYAKLFGKTLSGAIFCPPQSPMELAAFAKPTLASSLSDFGFIG